MTDMMLVAFKSDLTRVATCMMDEAEGRQENTSTSQDRPKTIEPEPTP